MTMISDLIGPAFAIAMLAAIESLLSAVIADGCTFESVRRVARAAAEIYARLPDGDSRQVVIGYDTRFASPDLARAAAEAFARAGIDVLLADRPIPTPAVSYHVRRLGLAGGLAITASHNPAHYNGVKIKTTHCIAASRATRVRRMIMNGCDDRPSARDAYSAGFGFALLRVARGYRLLRVTHCHPKAESHAASSTASIGFGARARPCCRRTRV
jgi:hypothetical protein